MNELCAAKSVFQICRIPVPLELCPLKGAVAPQAGRTIECMHAGACVRACVRACVCVCVHVCVCVRVWTATSKKKKHIIALITSPKQDSSSSSSSTSWSWLWSLLRRRGCTLMVGVTVTKGLGSSSRSSRRRVWRGGVRRSKEGEEVEEEQQYHQQGQPP